MNESVKLVKLTCNNITFNVAIAGPEIGPPVILLHGFPDAWFGWNRQIDRLASAGFRVIIPDQRGYNLSGKPKGFRSYQIENMVEDVVSIASELGYEKFSLAGHDWGAGVAWMLALKYPSRLSRLAILNVPHPKVFYDFVRTNFSQMLKSWYILFFQIPVIPEFVSRFNNWSLVLNQMPKLSEEEKLNYRKAWSEPGAITAMLNWYRAAVRCKPQIPREIHISVPTLIIWGRKDPYLDHRMADFSLKFCSDAELVLLEKATHWVMYDEPETVSNLLTEHFSKQ